MCSLQQISAASDSILTFLDRMFMDLHALFQNDIEIDFSEDFKQSQNSRVSSAQPSIQGELKFALGKEGLGDLTLDFLEQVQAVITRIGNALGLMRILAAGCTRYSDSISRYARKSKLDLNYSTSCKIVGWDDVAEIGKLLDVNTTNKDTLKEIIQPFPLLLTTFSQISEIIYEYKWS